MEWYIIWTILLLFTLDAVKGSENVLSGDESAATQEFGAEPIDTFEHLDHPEERQRRLFSRSFSPPIFHFQQDFFLCQKYMALSFKFIMWKTLGKMVYLGVDLVKNEIIVLSFIELLVLDPKQSINMKDDE